MSVDWRPCDQHRRSASSWTTASVRVDPTASTYDQHRMLPCNWTVTQRHTYKSDTHCAQQLNLNDTTHNERTNYKVLSVTVQTSMYKDQFGFGFNAWSASLWHNKIGAILASNDNHWTWVWCRQPKLTHMQPWCWLVHNEHRDASYRGGCTIVQKFSSARTHQLILWHEQYGLLQVTCNLCDM